MHFTCRQMATQNGVKSSASSDKTSELSNWSLHPKDPLIRIIERHFFWVHTAVKTQAPCVTNYMHQGAWRFICSILRGCRTLRSLCVPHMHIISLPESCKEHFDPAAPHWSHVLFLRQDFQTESSRSTFTFCNLGQQMVRGEREIKSLDTYLQAFFDRMLVLQLDFKLDAAAILRFKENYASKK